RRKALSGHGRPVNADPSEQLWSEGTRRAYPPARIEGQALLVIFAGAGHPATGKVTRLEGRNLRHQATKKFSPATIPQANIQKGRPAQGLETLPVRPVTHDWRKPRSAPFRPGVGAAQKSRLSPSNAATR